MDLKQDLQSRRPMLVARQRLREFSHFLNSNLELPSYFGNISYSYDAEKKPPELMHAGKVQRITIYGGKTIDIFTTQVEIPFFIFFNIPYNCRDPDGAVFFAETLIHASFRMHEGQVQELGFFNLSDSREFVSLILSYTQRPVDTVSGYVQNKATNPLMIHLSGGELLVKIDDSIIHPAVNLTQLIADLNCCGNTK